MVFVKIFVWMVILLLLFVALRNIVLWLKLRGERSYKDRRHGSAAAKELDYYVDAPPIDQPKPIPKLNQHHDTHDVTSAIDSGFD